MFSKSATLASLLFIAKSNLTIEKFAEAVKSQDAQRVRVILTKKPEFARRKITGVDGEVYPLLLAVKNNSLSMVSELLKSGLDVDYYQDQDQNTALHLAAKSGYLEIARLLLSYGAKVKLRNKDLKDGLILACQNGHGPLVNELLSKGADPNSYDKDGITSLMYAAHEGHVAVVKALLQHKANPDYMASLPSSLTSAPMTALTWAASGGRVEVVKVLIQQGASYDPSTLLLSLADLPKLTKSGHWDVIKLLLRTNDLVLKLDNEIRGKLVARACQEQQVGAAKELLGYGSWRSALDADDALLLAGLDGYTEAVQEAIWNGASVDTTDDFRRIPLMYAALRGSEEVAKELILWGSDVRHEDACGATSLLWAVMAGNVRVARLLLAYGADADCRDRSTGDSCLIKAVMTGDSELVDVMLQHGAQSNVRGSPGTALAVAAKQKDYKVVRLLLDGGANLRDANALFWAVKNQDLTTLRLLIDRGIDLNLTNNEDEHALMLACKLGFLDVVSMLIQHGVDINWRNRYGESPLMMAAMNQHVEVLKKMLEAEGLLKTDLEHLIAEVLADAAGTLRKKTKTDSDDGPPPIQTASK